MALCFFGVGERGDRLVSSFPGVVAVAASEKHMWMLTSHIVVLTQLKTVVRLSAAARPYQSAQTSLGVNTRACLAMPRW